MQQIFSTRDSYSPGRLPPLTILFYFYPTADKTRRAAVNANLFDTSLRLRGPQTHYNLFAFLHANNNSEVLYKSALAKTGEQGVGEPRWCFSEAGLLEERKRKSPLSFFRRVLALNLPIDGHCSIAQYSNCVPPRFNTVCMMAQTPIALISDTCVREYSTVVPYSSTRCTEKPKNRMLIYCTDSIIRFIMTLANTV